jgi:D-amino-acid dehydrogenase
MSLAPNPRWLNALRRAAAEYLILGAEPPLSAEAWAGLRPVTPTGLPILGYSPQHANLLLAAGHAMLGLSLGPGSGQLLTQLANRAPTFCDPTPFQISG